MDADGDQDFDDIDDFVGVLNGPVAPGARASNGEAPFFDNIDHPNTTHAAEKGESPLPSSNQPQDDELAIVWSNDVDWLGHSRAAPNKRRGLKRL
jgi:hypothetical protein